MIAQSHRWQKTAVAAAAIALLGLSTTGAWALSLGRITVLSALGEPLRAEIDVPEINAEEAATLKTVIASPESFTAAGLDYNPALSTLQTSLQRRNDGRAYIRLSSERPINDPFVDMIVEASWSSGRILRDYTLLFDPPVIRRPVPVTPTLAQTSPSASAPVTAPARPAPPPVAAEPARPVATRPLLGAPTPAPAKPPALAPTDDSKRIVVAPGDTAGKIAASIKPAGVSLDQMLVALLRANPDAFIKNNINRIRAGAVVDVPNSQQAQSLSPSEATQTVIAQSKDFNEFRRGLASNAPLAAVATASRKSGGAIESKVEDKKASAPTPDKLTLSKGSVAAKIDTAKIAKERADKEAAARAAELAKNIDDLKKLGTGSAPAVVVAQTKTVPTLIPTLPVAPAPAPAPAVAVVASAAVAVAASAPAPAAPNSAPAAVAVTPIKPAQAPAPAPEPLAPTSLLDDVLDNPWLPGGIAALVAMLGGFAFWRYRQRKKGPNHMDSSFLESRLQPDSFFGGSGGQRIDTNNESSAGGSSMVYSASQLDAADDVDPVAEADVYLAYGRDLQAEEILREAVRTNPGRLAIHTKLLEIFAKRRDAHNFEATANQAYQLAGASSPEWVRICEMGQAFDPGNALYQPGGVPTDTDRHSAGPNSVPAFNSTLAQSAAPVLDDSVSGVDLDLDLDFSLDELESSSAMAALTSLPVTAPKAEQTVKLNAADLNAPMDMDFDLSDLEPEPAPQVPDLPFDMGDLKPSPPSVVPVLPLSMDGLELPTDAPSYELPDFNLTTPDPIEPVAPPPAPDAIDSGMLEFDLGSLSLDLDTSREQLSEAPDSVSGDPLGTKLALAEEFVSIGDEDGARALIEEVVAEATGDMRAKAQRALANLR